MQALLRAHRHRARDVASSALAHRGARERLVSEALRPAATTERWRRSRMRDGFETRAEPALADVGMIEAANAEEEALAIAVALREAVETPDKTAALVTPDRALARRVVAALERWNVAADDSGGDALRRHRRRRVRAAGARKPRSAGSSR